MQTDYSQKIVEPFWKRLVQVKTGVYSAQCFNSWGAIQVGMVLFRIWHGTYKPARWRLELFTPHRRFRLSVLSRMKKK